MSSDLSNLPTEIVEACVNCKKSDSTRDASFEAWLCLISPYQVRNCVDCGLRWLSPRPTSVGYETVYSAENYFTQEAGSDIAYENLLNVRTAHFQARLNSIRDYLPEQKPLNILDYGAATGEFVVIARQLGHNCEGIEFSLGARQIALERNNVLLYAPDRLPENCQPFDVIHMNHVFEHMSDPAAHLEWCKAHMADNALLIIEVPQQFDNHIDRLKRFLGRGGKFDRFTAFSLHHTYFFTVKNLTALIENSGFTVLHLTTNVPGTRLQAKKTLNSTFIRGVSWLSNLLFSRGDNIEIYARLKKVDQS